MPTRILSGDRIAVLLEQARTELGADARIVSLRRTTYGSHSRYQLVVGPAAETPSTPPAPAPARRLPGTGPEIIALVGPTGAGKTTTLAKLANHGEAYGTRRVGLLCLDTYRVGAVEQARIYAELADLPLAVCYGTDDVVPGLRRLHGCDVVLIDTAGRGAHASGDHQTLKEQLRIASPHETHLVLPAGLHPSRARRALTESRGQGVTHLLITKLDEFPEERHLFGLAREFAVPARWVTDGQEVPRDLHRAERWWREGDVGSLGRIAREGLVTA